MDSCVTTTFPTTDRISGCTQSFTDYFSLEMHRSAVHNVHVPAPRRIAKQKTSDSDRADPNKEGEEKRSQPAAGARTNYGEPPDLVVIDSAFAALPSSHSTAAAAVSHPAADGAAAGPAVTTSDAGPREVGSGDKSTLSDPTSADGRLMPAAEPGKTLSKVPIPTDTEQSRASICVRCLRSVPGLEPSAQCSECVMAEKRQFVEVG